MLVILWLWTPKLSTLTAFRAVFGSHNGNVNHFGAVTPKSVCFWAFWAFGSHMGYVDHFGAFTPILLTLPAFQKLCASQSQIFLTWPVGKHGYIYIYIYIKQTEREIERERGGERGKVALQKLHWTFALSAVRRSFAPKAALQQAKKRIATLKSRVARKWRFPAAFLRISAPHFSQRARTFKQ